MISARIHNDIFFQTKPHTSELKSQSTRGGFVALVSQGLKFFVRLGSMMLLARLLTAEDFGLQGMVAALTGFLTLFRDAGLSAVTVQREEITRNQVSTLFWINAAVGVLLCLALVSAAPLVAKFYREPRLFWVCIISAAAFIFNGAAVQHLALLQRQMRFGALAGIEGAALILSSAAAVVMALLGFGYWSLVAMMVIGPMVTLIGAVTALPWIPGSPHRNCGLRSMLKFGGVLTTNSLVVYLGYNLEKILLGRFWGADALGLYGRAYQLVTIPSDQINSAIGSVAFPSLARLQNDPDRLARAFLKGYSLMLGLTVPITVTCIVFARDVVLVALGSDWISAVPIFRLLTPTIVVFALINPFAWFLISSGRTRQSLIMAFMITPTLIVAAALGLKGGPTGVALAISTAMALLVVPLLAYAKNGTPIKTSSLFTAIIPAFVAGLVASMVGWAAIQLIGETQPALVRLVIGTTIVFTVHFLVLLFPLGQKNTYFDVIQQFRARRSST
jgi:O-antigen/teichoic acid export membrane protein